MLISSCIACELYKGIKSSKMEPSGEGKTGVLLFGEAPGKTEDEQGRQFVGNAGNIIFLMIFSTSLSIFVTGLPSVLYSIPKSLFSYLSKIKLPASSTASFDLIN